MDTSQKLLARIFKDYSVQHTVTSIAKASGLSRVGAWKALKKLESEKLIKLKQIGKGKTSASIVELNPENILTDKTLELTLAQEAQNNIRWMDNLKALEKEADFIILFGSILHSPNEANDIDLLIVADKSRIAEIINQISKIQKSQIRKIHSALLTEPEFKAEIKSGNKAYSDAIKKGVVLFGQEKFIKLMKEMKK